MVGARGLLLQLRARVHTPSVCKRGRADPVARTCASASHGCWHPGRGCQRLTGRPGRRGCISCCPLAPRRTPWRPPGRGHYDYSIDDTGRLATGPCLLWANVVRRTLTPRYGVSPTMPRASWITFAAEARGLPCTQPRGHANASTVRPIEARTDQRTRTWNLCAKRCSLSVPKASGLSYRCPWP